MVRARAQPSRRDSLKLGRIGLVASLIEGVVATQPPPRRRADVPMLFTASRTGDVLVLVAGSETLPAETCLADL